MLINFPVHGERATYLCALFIGARSSSSLLKDLISSFIVVEGKERHTKFETEQFPIAKHRGASQLWTMWFNFYLRSVPIWIWI